MAEITNPKLDRMRYTKDKRSSRMVLLAIVLNVLYFVSIYQQDHPNVTPNANYPYYTWLIGGSVVLNLLFLLFGFLCSESVKARKNGYTIPLMCLGLLQIGRIFYLPAKAHAATYEVTKTVDNVRKNVLTPVMTNGQYIFAVSMLALSGVLLILAAVNSYVSKKKLEEYMKTIES